MAQQLRANRQDRLRRAASELLRMLRQVKGSSDTPETRVLPETLETTYERVKAALSI